MCNNNLLSTQLSYTVHIYLEFYGRLGSAIKPTFWIENSVREARAGYYVFRQRAMGSHEKGGGEVWDFYGALKSRLPSHQNKI